MEYEKLNSDENITIGDVLGLEPESNKVLLANTNRYTEQFCDIHRIGVCTNVNNNIITVTSEGIVDVNTYGNICIGDKLTTGTVPGKAVAIRYVREDEILFKKKSIGKVIGLYDVYNKARVLLNMK